MNINNSYSHKLTCVQFPGNVQKPEKAISCLGGLPAISKACESPKSCMELNFRPKDPFCKPALSTTNEITGILLKIRVKKKKSKVRNKVERSIISTEVLGVVDEIYSFQTLVDYQYVSIAPLLTSEVKGDQQCILHDIIPPMIPELEWLDKPRPYFFVPPIFSRITAPQAYSYCDVQHTDVDPDFKNIISKLRKTRSNFAHYLNFTHTDSVPSIPKKQAMEIVNEENQYIKILREAFEKKPIMNRIELNCLTNIPSPELKVLLGTVAYNYMNGPWRGLWVKLGYDPRKDPQSRIWQCIDYRVKAISKVTRKDKKINYSFTPIKDGRFSTRRKVQETNSMGEPIDSWKDERLYLFKPDVLPIKTQTFYQFCNIQVPEIQDMFARLGEVLPGALCHEKRGWLPTGFHEQCRQIMSKHTLALLKQSIGNKSNQPNDSFESQSVEDEPRSDGLSLDDGDIDDYDDDDDDEDYDDDNVFPESDVD